MTRALLVLAVLAFFGLCVLAMYWGYRNRSRRQAAELPEFPQPPAGLSERLGAGEGAGDLLLPPATGVYVSTTTDASWQDRVAVGDVGYRAEATLYLVRSGLLIDRAGASPMWIPADAVREARVGQGLAGKVMFGDGLLIVRWQLGDRLLDSGFRGDDKDVYEQWVTALRSLSSVGGGA